MSNASTPSPENIAETLGGFDTVPEGERYLDSLGLTLQEMQAVAPFLGLTRYQQLSKKDLRVRLLRQAIGARRKYEILRDWRGY